LERLDYLISGYKIKVETDHQPILGIVKGDSKGNVPTPRCARLLKKLSPWFSRDIEIVYVRGKLNPADILSRTKEENADTAMISCISQTIEILYFD